MKAGPLAGYLNGTLGLPSHQPRHVTAWLSGRQIVIALIVIAVMVVLLVAPLVGGALAELASQGVEKAAPGTFFLGLGILAVGLVAGVRIIDIAGASVAGAAVLGVILNNYLLRTVARADVCRPPRGLPSRNPRVNYG